MDTQIAVLKPAAASAERDRTAESRHASILEGLFGSPGNTLVSSYGTPLALAYGATALQIGFLGTLQSLATVAAQLPGAWLVKRVQNRKRVWNASSSVHRLLLLPLVALSLLVAAPAPPMVPLILACLAGVSFFLALKNPAWSSLMGDLVPREIRGRYFGRRSALIGASALAGMLAGGWMAQGLGFWAVFASAFGLGSISLLIVNRRITEVPYRAAFAYTRAAPSLEPVGRALKTEKPFLGLTTFLAVLNAAVALTSPFYAVYMLQDMGLGLLLFTGVIAFGSLASLASMRYWGKLCDRIGDRSVLAATAALSVLIPLSWFFVSEPWHAFVASAVDGFAWSGVGIAGFNLLLASSNPERRERYVAVHTMAKEGGAAAGALAGGVFAASGIALGWWSGFSALFLLGAGARLLACALLPLVRRPDGSRERGALVPRGLLWDVAVLGPGRGGYRAVRRVTREAVRVPRRLQEGARKVRDRARLTRS